MKIYRKVDARTQGVYCKILLNAVWTQSRMARMPDNDDDPTCTCGTEEENLRHLWWRCPRWADIRGRHGLSDHAHDNLPVATGDLEEQTSGDLAPIEDF